MFRSNGRGKFDESVFSKETNGVGHFVRRNKVATSVVLGLTALVGLGIACNKAGLFNGAKKTTSDQKQHLSHIA